MLRLGGKYRYLYAKAYREVRPKMKDTRELNKLVNTKGTNKKESATDLSEAWLSGGVMTRLEPFTYENYYRCINKYAIPYFRLPSSIQLSGKSIRQPAEEISQDTAISVSYRRKILSILRTALREIYRDAPNRPSVAGFMTLPKARNSKEMLVFFMKEQRVTEHVVQQSEDKRLLGTMLCFYSGTRLDELYALKWEDFDFEAGAASTTRTVSRIRNREPNGEKTVLRVGTPKSETSLRKIPLPAFLLRLIEKYSLPFEEGDCYMLSGKAAPFDPQIYQRICKKVLAAMGVKDRKFHTIHHASAARALELGVDIKTPSEILGHSSVNITLNVYIRSLTEQKRVAIEKFSEIHVMYMKSMLFAADSTITASRMPG